MKEMTNLDIIYYISKKIEERAKAIKKDKYTEMKDSFVNKQLEASK